jgi:V/A-type H+-transporting ATPase subunit I
MKKMTLIAMADAAREAVTRLQDLGVIHLELATEGHDADEEGSIFALREKISSIKEVIQILSELRRQNEKSPETRNHSEATDVSSKRLDEEIERIEKIDEVLAQLQKTIDDFKGFGNFDPQKIVDLANKGVFVKLYRTNKDALPVVPEHAAFVEIQQIGHESFFAVVSDKSFVLEIPEMVLPETSPANMQKQFDALQKEKQQIQACLLKQSAQIPVLQQELLGLEDHLAQALAYESMQSQGNLVWLQGFCPANKVSAVEANQLGWGLVINDPAEDELVPTLIENPRWLKPVEVVFNFIETYPGYREKDVSPIFFVFLTLFYAMLIGDAGYGLVFLAIAGGVHFKFGHKIPKHVLSLFYVLNIATVFWGLLSGTYFGIALPEGSFLNKIALIDGDNIKQMMILCFIVGLVQLTLARVWNIICLINSRKAFAEVGWLLTLWTAFFIAMSVIAGVPFPSFMTYVGVVGMVMALVFSGSLTDVAGLFQFPFSVINCFSDIASYLRLFAVGSAAVALARVFNGMASELMDGGVVSLIGGLLILLLGHSLNLVLGLLSVLVHGLRLNLLEFSGHVGLEWTGFKYNPFRCNRSTNDQTQ